MPAASLLALLDDIATVLDDVALLGRAAAQKTAGVLGDDLALNAQQVSGIRAEREIPVVLAVARGSFRNKAILVPLALAISALAPWGVSALLMVGGLYLCFEGAEKLLHSVLHGGSHGEGDETASARHEELVRHLTDTSADMATLEQERVRGAIRTDFVLSAEIITITLGTVAHQPLWTQVLVLAGVAVLMTVGVYGLVAGIVKLDDAGLWLSQRPGEGAAVQFGRWLGAVLLQAAPWLMKTLAVVGTAAMFMVGGGILLHGWPALHHAVQALFPAGEAGGLAWLWAWLHNGLAGLVSGAVVVALQFVVCWVRRTHWVSAL